MAVLSRAPAERHTIAIPTWDLWFTNLVTAVNEATAAAAAPAAAGTLTGTTLAANVVNSSLVITDGQLSSNVALKNGTNAFTGANSFATNPIDLLVGQLKFPATQNPSSNANTYDDYEEGAWTPTDASGAGLALTTGTCTYVKNSQFTAATFEIVYPVTASGAALVIGGLPFTSQTTTLDSWSVDVSFTNNTMAAFTGMVRSNTTQFRFFTTAGAPLTNVQMSTFGVRGTALYRTAS